MTDYADLELGLSRADAEHYRVDFRFTEPKSGVDTRLAGPKMPLAAFDMAALDKLGDDPAAYGALLGQSLFADKSLHTAFAQAWSTQLSGVLLRLRLYIDASAPELHRLRWETMVNPLDGTVLATSERILFTRYLSSQDWRRVRLSARKEPRCLVAIPNPSDLAEYGLAPIDTAGEMQRVQKSLGKVAVTDLRAAGPVQLNQITSKLREDFDLLFLVCHGALMDGRPVLCLEDEQGKTCFVDGGELVTRIKELQAPPRLVVLASCQSAAMQAGADGILSALGPQLAAGGIAAVIAMQGNIAQETEARFMEAFFRELVRDGQVDRAMATARGAVRDRPDFWMPALFMRLRSGRISYESGFESEQESMQKWPALVSHMLAGRCTPILGPGLTDWLFGSRREMAAHWAETFGYPMSADSRESLPQVAQYVAVDRDVATMQQALSEHLAEEVRLRFGAELAEGSTPAMLDDLLSVVGDKLKTEPATHPLRTLAALPLPIYITTQLGNFIADALKAAGKQPVVEICRWNDYLELQPSIFDREPDYRPNAQRPLVYHLFGRLSEPDSLVLTEDDFFDFLIGATSRNDLIPPVVRRALTDSALLFLGFELDDWDFRVLFRSVMSREGRRRRSKYAHVAAQIDPEGGRIVEPQRARKYLESYFEDVDISIYWGSVADFSTELERRMQSS
jgi:hypothetical protein